MTKDQEGLSYVTVRYKNQNFTAKVLGSAGKVYLNSDCSYCNSCKETTLYL